MKEIIPPPPPIVRNQFETVRELFSKHVIPSYARFDIAFSRGSGSTLWDVSGKRYLDFGGGIAVCSLGHAHPEITQALVEQSQRLIHVSNLYYNEPQGRLAQQIVKHLAPGKMFFCNSGAEANEGLFKLARKFGHAEGRFEIIATQNSFHGRTLAGISATGQEKVKQGFEPMVAGFRHVPFNDLQAMRDAISPATAAILIEGVQGEGGITVATPEYLLGLRQFCDEKKLLLLIDGVQCGHFRTGRFQSFQRILESAQRAAGVSPEVPANNQTHRQDADSTFLPDGIAMAKSLGGGFPIGALWVREKYADLLGAGTHGTTFGGTPLGCAVALKILEVIERDCLATNARETGEFLKAGLQRLVNSYPNVLKSVRGLGFMIGLELVEKEKVAAFAKVEKAASIQFVNRLHEAGLLTIPSRAQVIRLLPPLNLSKAEAQEGLEIIERAVRILA
jgi:acetylornithine aminotransferase/acetylornithine/N-succinyldiaminopimelate aminotransferase